MHFSVESFGVVDGFGGSIGGLKRIDQAGGVGFQAAKGCGTIIDCDVILGIDVDDIVEFGVGKGFEGDELRDFEGVFGGVVGGAVGGGKSDEFLKIGDVLCVPCLGC